MVKREDQVIDLVFKQKLEQQQALKRQRRRKKRRRLVTLMIVLGVFTLYFMTDISKPKVININGNQLMSKDEILEVANISLKSNLIYANPLLVNYRLKQHPFIQDVHTKTSLWNRIISITIDEIAIFGYRQDDETKMILSNGESKTLPPDLYHFLPDLIYVNGFIDGDDQKRLVDSFKNLDQAVKTQISEIHQTSVSYDDKLIEILMNDGNRVFSSFQSIESLNYYFEIIPRLEIKNRCLFIDEMSQEIFSQPCDDYE